MPLYATAAAHFRPGSCSPTCRIEGERLRGDPNASGTRRNERSELQVLIDFLLPSNPNAYAQMQGGMVIQSPCAYLILGLAVLSGRMRHNADVYLFSLAGLLFELSRPDRCRPN